MSISFIVNEDDPAFVRLCCSGLYTRDSLLSVFNQAIEIATSRSRRAVLIEIFEVRGAPADMFERYELGVGAARIQRERRPLVALAVVGSEPAIHPSRIGEIVFHNRGGVGRVFIDLEEALAWLNEGFR
jgi:hypothetical protein